MEEYSFLFFIAGAWLLVASIQDINKTEVANWVSYSLIGFAFAYRTFYSVIFNDFMFLANGGIGFALFFLLAHAFYYSRTFGGADARLLMAMGVILPFENPHDFLFLTAVFIFLLFFSGLIYSLIYSIFKIIKRKEKFILEIKKEKKRNLLVVTLGILITLIILVFTKKELIEYLFAGFVLIISIIFVYLKAFEKSCMIVLKKPDELMEGDWLIEDIKIGKKSIKNSVHGLSREDILLLVKNKKKVWIKNGIPFVPSFLISFLIMVFFWTFLKEYLLAFYLS